MTALKMEQILLKYYIRYLKHNQNTQQKNSEVFMKIEVKKEDLEKLAQFIYLGNTIINGYKKNNEVKTDYALLAQDIYRQIIENIPERKSNYKFTYMPNDKSIEAKIADFCDKIYDSVEDDYLDFQNALFDDLINQQNS